MYVRDRSLTFAILQHPQLSIVRRDRFRHVAALVGRVPLEPANEQRSSGGQGETQKPWCSAVRDVTSGPVIA